MTRLRHYLFEPVNALTHFVGGLASFIGLCLLLFLTRHDLLKMTSMLIYGVSMIILYMASALFHGLKVSKRSRMWLNRLDHIAIFLLIAGTYTPILLNLFPTPWRWYTLAFIWFGSLLGMVFKLLSDQIHGFLNAFSYVVLSWSGVVPLLFVSGLWHRITLNGLLLLLLGGFIYMVGFLIYYTRRPNPWPNILGHHEIWHLCVMGGSLCHFLFILFFVVPADNI